MEYLLLFVALWLLVLTVIALAWNQYKLRAAYRLGVRNERLLVEHLGSIGLRVAALEFKQTDAPVIAAECMYCHTGQVVKDETVGPYGYCTQCNAIQEHGAAALAALTANPALGLATASYVPTCKFCGKEFGVDQGAFTIINSCADCEARLCKDPGAYAVATAAAIANKEIKQATWAGIEIDAADLIDLTNQGGDQ